MEEISPSGQSLPEPRLPFEADSRPGQVIEHRIYEPQEADHDLMARMTDPIRRLMLLVTGDTGQFNNDREVVVEDLGLQVESAGDNPRIDAAINLRQLYQKALDTSNNPDSTNDERDEALKHMMYFAEDASQRDIPALGDDGKDKAKQAIESAKPHILILYEENGELKEATYDDWRKIVEERARGKVAKDGGDYDSLHSWQKLWAQRKVDDGRYVILAEEPIIIKPGVKVDARASVTPPEEFEPFMIQVNEAINKLIEQLRLKGKENADVILGLIVAREAKGEARALIKQGAINFALSRLSGQDRQAYGEFYEAHRTTLSTLTERSEVAREIFTRVATDAGFTESQIAELVSNISGGQAEKYFNGVQQAMTALAALPDNPSAEQIKQALSSLTEAGRKLATEPEAQAAIFKALFGTPQGPDIEKNQEELKEVLGEGAAEKWLLRGKRFTLWLAILALLFSMYGGAFSPGGGEGQRQQ